jgi:hypothetical protein
MLLRRLERLPRQHACRPQAEQHIQDQGENHSQHHHLINKSTQQRKIQPVTKHSSYGGQCTALLSFPPPHGGLRSINCADSSCVKTNVPVGFRASFLTIQTCCGECGLRGVQPEDAKTSVGGGEGFSGPYWRRMLTVPVREPFKTLVEISQPSLYGGRRYGSMCVSVDVSAAL